MKTVILFVMAAIFLVLPIDGLYASAAARIPTLPRESFLKSACLRNRENFYFFKQLLKLTKMF
jgi:hypothetical protein